MILKFLTQIFIFKVLILCHFSHANFPFQFIPSSLQSPSTLQAQTSLTSLCHPSLPTFICLSQLSFPLSFQQNFSSFSPQMMTPFIAEPKNISQRRTRRLLREGNWKSYSYSRSTNTYEELEEEELEERVQEERVREEREREEREREEQVQEEQETEKRETEKRELEEQKTEKRETEEQEPTRGYSYLHFRIPEDNQPQIVIRESVDSNGRYTSQSGTLRSLPTENIDMNQDEKLQTTQATPVYNIVHPASDEDLNDSVCASVEKPTSQAPCIECQQQNKGPFRFIAEAMLAFKNTVSRRAEHFNLCRGVREEQIIANFNRNCPMNFTDFKSELQKRSCEKGIPPAVILAMMSVESSGRCTVKGDGSRSIGLFQINTDYHTDFPAECSPPLASHPKQSISVLNTSHQCLENPLVNLNKSIEILTANYSSVNEGRPPQQNQCTNVSDENLDRWRKAVAAYNGGSKRIQSINRLTQRPPQGWEPLSNWNQISEWEKMRAHYFNCQRRDAQSVCRQGNDGAEIFNASINNLAHTELVLGRSFSDSSFFTEWNNFLAAQQISFLYPYKF